MEDRIATFILWLLALVAIADWACVIILGRAMRHDGETMRERHRVAVIMAHAATFYLVVGLNTTLGYPWFDRPITIVLNRLIFLILGLVPVGFLLFYRSIRSK